MAIEQECSFLCPYCSSGLSILVDGTGGKKQAFTNDCEVCCRPILIRLEIGSDGVESFQAEQES